MGCFSFFFRHRPHSPKGFPEFEDELSEVQNLKLYSYKELKAATDDFSLANKIGEGGFGPVYLGKLRHGNQAAIKVLSAESRQGAREFLTEIKVISDIEHENLAKLIGCCVEGDHRILVYDYIENNSLAQTLLGSGHSSIQFSWRTRTKICIGIARGLAFLHEEVRPHIVHRDIKASNILLDKDLTPKISDFGLAKLIPANMTHVSTRVAGTIGYLAPEYAIRGQLTRRADVYSFGVLLVEIVSGRCNTNSLLPADEQYILERVWNLYERNELVEIVDTAMYGDFDAEEACKYLKIGLLCTQDNPKLRPVMSTVVKMLSGEMKIDETQITKPGLISDFMDLKIRSNPNKTTDATNDPKKNTFNTTSSGSDNAEHSLLSSNATSQSTMTFTDVWDRH
ncbi:protein kinase superfamily protein [Artemisia annua]|uniref:Protein kinase superfamily protein n=1 Tax=Artemisia annua TaxID=35608 RepID=A0A2U1KM25_ARTAN|nr:protein kinase superfamily protein [Artemisia annua]